MLILTRSEVESLLDPQDLLVGLEEGFKALSANQLSVPGRNQVTAPLGLLVGMPAYMPGRLMSVKLVSVFHENHKQNIPDHQAVISLFDSETGSPMAFMDGEYITALRTAAAAVLSIQTLARKNITTAAIIGAGVLGAAHLKMLENLEGIRKIWVASKDAVHAQVLSAKSPLAATADTAHQAVSAADVICLCTSSFEPVIDSSWPKEGAHITSVGYRPPGAELPRELIEKAHVFVESKAAFSPPPVGSVELQGLDVEFGTELGEVFLNQKPGRRNDREITIYKSMGHAMEDLVAANLVYEKALRNGTGLNVQL